MEADRTNTWGLEFMKIDLQENKIESILGLNMGTEEYTRSVFNKIKNEFAENKGDPEVVIDLLDESDDIIEDFSVTTAQALSISSLLGHTIK